MIVPQGDDGRGDLRIKNVQIWHEGRYTCTAQTVVDSDSAYADLKVVGQCRMISLLISVTVYQKASSSLILKFHWIPSSVPDWSHSIASQLSPAPSTASEPIFFCVRA